MKTDKIRELNPEEILAKVQELKAGLSKLRISKAKGELKNAGKLMETRHDIARLLTILKEKGNK
jgi:large subunit ribosomal protein L29